jgi:hypothetical protein
MAVATKRGRAKGTRKTGGRKRGTPNKVTVRLKDALEASFVAVGGQTYLEALAKDDPRTYVTLLGKILPSEIAGSLDVNVTHEDALAALGATVATARQHKNGADKSN